MYETNIGLTWEMTLDMRALPWFLRWNGRASSRIQCRINSKMNGKHHLVKQGINYILIYNILETFHRIPDTLQETKARLEKHGQKKLGQATYLKL